MAHSDPTETCTTAAPRGDYDVSGREEVAGAGQAGGLGGGGGIGLFFAFWSWVGFEMAPDYGEECRDPERNIPRALCVSVIALGVFQTLTAWASLAGYPTTHAAIAASQCERAGRLVNEGL